MNQNGQKIHSSISHAVIIFLMLLLWGRACQMQLFQHGIYHHAAENNRRRSKVMLPNRGKMFDRKNRILVGNVPSYTIWATPFDLSRNAQAKSQLGKLLGVSEEYLNKILAANQRNPYAPVRIRLDADYNLVAKIEEYKTELPGVEYSVEPRRNYPLPIRAAHVLGYVGEVSSTEISAFPKKKYSPGDYIGKMGLEKEYENELSGRRGVVYTEVDAHGLRLRRLPQLVSEKSIPGRNLILTLDADLQYAVEEAFSGKKGAAVVLDVTDGGVLALGSFPDFAPDFFSTHQSRADWQMLISDAGFPFYNRAVQSIFPPGSTFKLVLALSALENNIVDPATKIFCPGYSRIGNRTFMCWRHSGHGSVDMHQAIAQSCNVYFYQLMLKNGLSKWSSMADRLKFGMTSGIDLPHESAGVLPDSMYLAEKFGRNQWHDGELANLAVGQGEVLTTPLQMAQLALILANNGHWHQPHLVQKIQNENFSEEYSNLPVATENINLSSASLKIVQKGMYAVVNSAKGTAKRAALPHVRVAGKTGTAQNPHGESHAWFMGYAPANKPQIAIVIFVENGGSGGAVAAPIAREICRTYFQNSSIIR